MADRIVVMNRGSHRAGRHAARRLRDAGHAVRRRFRRQDQRAARRWPQGGGRVRVGELCSRVAPRASSRAGTRGEALPAPRGHRRASRPATGGVRQHAGGAGRQGRVPRRVLLLGLALEARRVRRRSSPTCRGTASTPAALAPGAPVAIDAAAGGDARAGLIARWPPPRRAAAPGAARRAVRARRPSLHWQERLAQALLLACCAALALFLLGAAGDDPGEERAGQGRRVRRPRAVPRVPRARRRCGSRSGTRCGSRSSSPAITVPLAFTFAYALTRSVHARQGAVPHRSR